MASVTQGLQVAHVAQLSFAHLTLIEKAERIAREALSETETHRIGAKLMRAVNTAKGRNVDEVTDCNPEGQRNHGLAE